MNLDIGNFNLTSDKYNVTVHERYEKEDGSEGLRFVGHYWSVQAALRKLKGVAIKQSEAQSVNELLEVLDRYKQDIDILIASVDFDSYRADMQEVPQDDLGFLD